MIDENKTLEIFGYKSIDISRNKPVIALCNNCNKTRQISKAAALKSIICLKCQRIIQAKKIASINRIGRKHSEETKIKIGTSNKISQKTGSESPRFGIKISDIHKEAIKKANKNRIISDITRNKMRQNRLGKKASIETKLKMSQMRLANPTRIGHKAAHGQGKYYTSIIGEKLWMRSSWEYKLAEYLDNLKLDWLYEPYAFPIEYEYNSIIKKGTFRPDFWLFTKNGPEYWEVKGYWRDDAKTKFEAFVSQYPHLTIKLKEKKELIDLGLLKS